MPDTEPPAAPPRPRLRLSIGAAIVLGIVVLSAAVGWGILRGRGEAVEALPLPEPTDAIQAAEIYVHVLGEVADPGLYVLDARSRVVDALAAAGGSLDDADLRAVNLARPLSDGEQLIVPAVGAQPQETAGGVAADGVIDLNTADQTALETLPRIGPALAQRIVEWREQNGRFASVDDLLAVPGIGDKLLAGIRDLVRV